MDDRVWRKCQGNSRPSTGNCKVGTLGSPARGSSANSTRARSVGETPLTLWLKKPKVGSAAASENNTDAVALAPCVTGDGAPDHSDSPEEVNTPKDSSVCDICRQRFNGARGVSVHTRRMHPTESHARAQRQSEGRKKPWNDEERYTVAVEEARLVKAGVERRRLNGMLAEKFSDRSECSLKCERRQARFQAILSTVTKELNESRPRVYTVEEDSTVPNDNSVVPEWRLTLAHALQKKRTSAYLCTTSSLLNREFKRWMRNFPVRRQGARRKVQQRPPAKKGNRNARRRRLRAAWLDAYEKNQTRTSKRVIQGANLGEEEEYPEGMTEFWSEIFEKPSRPTGRAERDPWGKEESPLLRPFTGGEVKFHLRSMKSGAPGVDGVTLQHLKAVDPYCLAEWFNCFLLLGMVPRVLKQFKTIFIAKCENPSSPTQYRPITIGSYVRRLFAGILAKRLNKSNTGGVSCQRGFKEVEGCAINQEILRAVVNGHIGARKSLNYVFLDVAKAFDSVAHSRLDGAFRKASLPKGLGDLFAEMYRGNTTTFNGGTKVIRIKKGVLQGDPLSPVIFNLVMDVAVRCLKESVGAALEGSKVSALLFADDAVLLSESVSGLQMNVDRFVSKLASFGLGINAAKSAAVHIGVNGKKKSWFVRDTSSIVIQGEKVKALKVGESYKYLGLKLSLGKCVSNTVKDLDVMLQNITRSVLKPQHKLAILRSHAIPKVEYALDLGESSKGILRDCDRHIRRAVRKWVHLPKDVPISLFHVKTKDGGLGIPSLRTKIPRLRKQRWIRINSTENPDPQLAGLLASPYWRLKEESQELAAVAEGSQGDTTYNLKMKEREYWRDALYSTTDGEGLRSHSSGSSYNSKFFDDNFLRLTGKEFVKALHLRCGSLRTPARSNRGRVEGRGPMCPSCPDKVASIGHLLQCCGRTHLQRVGRHDTIVKELARKLRTLGYETVLEPHIPVGQSHEKPDIVAYRKEDQKLLVLDPTIVNCKCCLDTLAAEKSAKYSNTAVFEWLVAKYGACGRRENVTVDGIVLNFRGAWSPRSAQTLLDSGVRPGYLEVLSFRVLKLGNFIYDSLWDRPDWGRSWRDRLARRKKAPSRGGVAHRGRGQRALTR